jgi:hypothetical protein
VGPGRPQIPRERRYRSLGPIVAARWTEFTMTRRRRTRGMRGAGTIAKRPDGRWRLRVSINGRQVTYGTYSTEDRAADAQARWRLTHLLPVDDPEQAVEDLVGLRSGKGPAELERQRRTTASGSHQLLSKTTRDTPLWVIRYAASSQVAWSEPLRRGARAFWLAFAYPVAEPPLRLG